MMILILASMSAAARRGWQWQWQWPLPLPLAGGVARVPTGALHYERASSCAVARGSKLSTLNTATPHPRRGQQVWSSRVRGRGVKKKVVVFAADEMTQKCVPGRSV